MMIRLDAGRLEAVMESGEVRRQPWEYRSEEYPMQGDVPLGLWLSSRGREGWELVTLIHHAQGDHLYTAVWKRPGLASPARPGKPVTKGKRNA